MGRIISVCSDKGGVGKTTTVINLAGFLSLAGRRTLVIDLDPQGNSTSGLSAKRSEVDPFEALADSHLDWDRVIQKTDFRNLFLLAASVDQVASHTHPPLPAHQISKVRASLLQKEQRFDYVLLDTPPAISGTFELGAKLSDTAIIPVQCEFFSMESLSRLIPALEAVGRSRGRAAASNRLLPTMFDEELQICHEVVSELNSHFPTEITKTIIPREVSLSEAAGHGLPIFSYDPRSRGAWAYLNLAKEILDHERK